MTTAELLTELSYGDLATGAINMEFRLRRLLIPEFLNDVDKVCGKPWWRWGFLTLSVVANTRSYALPTDFRMADKLAVYDADEPAIGGYFELTYRGEFSSDQLLAELGGADDGERDMPLGYYVVSSDDATSSTTARPLLYLTKTPTINFTIKGRYTKRVPFADNTTSVNLDAFIPIEWQVVLFKMCERELAKARYGSGDKRYDLADKEYRTALNTKIGDKHAATPNRVTLMR